MAGYNYYSPMYQPYYSAPQQSPSSIIWVRNNQEAAMYPVAPNNAVALWDSSSPVIYLKQADASGKPSMKTYDLVERVDAPAEQETKDLATKSELAALAGVVKDVDGVIASLREDVDSLKNKVPVKRIKKEDEE
jgi:hypothetical protein